MVNKNNIGIGQLFCLLFTAHSCAILTGTQLQGVESSQDLLLAAPLSFFLMLLCLLPTFCLNQHHPDRSLLDCARYLLTDRGGAVVCFLYGLYFLYIPVISVARYNLYLSSTMLPNAPFLLLSLALAATACYGAFMGMEALARACGFIFVAIVIALVFIFAALIPRLDLLNFTVPNSNFQTNAAKSSLSLLSDAAELALPAIFLPLTKGKRRGKLLFWLIGESVLVFLIGFFVTGVLGPYASTQAYPFYLASTFAELGSLQRLDSFYTAVWTAGLFVRACAFLLAFSLCVSGIWGERFGKFSLLFGAVFFFIGGTVLANIPSLIPFLSNTVSLPATLFFVLLLPLLLYLVDSIRSYRLQRRGEAS